MPNINYIEMVADGLKEHCENWGYDWIEKLKEDSSVRNFRKLFFNVTHLYYIPYQKEHYSVTFDKKENTAAIKKCGSDWDERDNDATIDIEELITALVR